MYIILPGSIKTISGHDGIVIVLDHQPPLTNPRIEADFETASVYQDQSYNNIEQIIKDHNIDVKHIYMDHYI